MSEGALPGQGSLPEKVHFSPEQLPPCDLIRRRWKQHLSFYPVITPSFVKYIFRAQQNIMSHTHGVWYLPNIASIMSHTHGLVPTKRALHYVTYSRGFST